MSEHRTNPMAIGASMLPAVVGTNRDLQVALTTHVEPSAHVMIVPAGRLREEARIQEYQNEVGEWVTVPMGKTCRVFGEPLASSDCDLVISIASRVVDTGLVLTGPNGAHGRRASQIPLGEILRVPLAAFQARHEDNLSGTLTAK